MKLTLQIKLLPNDVQATALLKTIKEANRCCDAISQEAWKQKIFNQYKIQKEVYHPFRAMFNLSSQVMVRCISKVADAYKLDRKTNRKFRVSGAVAYDSRILSYSTNSVSIWSVSGRLKIPFVCHDTWQLPYIKGEADLIFRKGKYYLLQSVDIPDTAITEVAEFIGCDFGQTDICTLSDGTNFNSQQLKEVRKKYTKVRASVQAKGTKSSRRLLKRLSGRERRFVRINNHWISKQIVAKAKEENKGIAIEDLSGIRKTAKSKSKAQKTELNRWSFYQLRQFLEYKAKGSGVQLFAVPPAYTSQMCSTCFHMGERKAKDFRCNNCGNRTNADHNAAKNIAAWGCVVNQPESSILYCVNALHD